MKKTEKWLVIFLALSLVFTSFYGCGGNKDVAKPESEVVETPAEVQAVMDKVTSLATNYALKLDGEFGDMHTELIASEQGRDYSDYEKMKAKLDEFRTESGAYYVYCLIDVNPDDEYFEITVDGSVEPDDWLNQYETESQFIAAMKGIPTPAPSAWDNDVNDPAWSAFAPIHDSKGNIVAILGIDYPAPEILNFPEWNRDSEEFSIK